MPGDAEGTSARPGVGGASSFNPRPSLCSGQSASHFTYCHWLRVVSPGRRMGGVRSWHWGSNRHFQNQEICATGVVSAGREQPGVSVQCGGPQTPVGSGLPCGDPRGHFADSWQSRRVVPVPEAEGCSARCRFPGQRSVTLRDSCHLCNFHGWGASRAAGGALPGRRGVGLECICRLCEHVDS